MSESKENSIEHLRKLFAISVAAFDFQDKISQAFFNRVIPSEMKALHRIALEEVNKENPDMDLIDSLLEKMEILSELNSQTTPKFPSGGITLKSTGDNSSTGMCQEGEIIIKKPR